MAVSNPISAPQETNYSDGVCSLRVDAIRKDGDTQTRAALDDSVIRHYCELLKDDTRFPPLRVWFDGESFWLVDGFHRLAAAEKAGFKYVTAAIHHGSLEEAIWDSFNANSQHGLPRKHNEVAAIIRRALEHKQAANLSNLQISQHLGIPETTLRRWRKKLSPPCGEDEVRRAVRAGKTYSIRTGNIGRHSIRPQVPKKTMKQLNEEFSEMQKECSASAAHILGLIQHWIFKGTSKLECLAEIERVLTSREQWRTAPYPR